MTPLGRFTAEGQPIVDTPSLESRRSFHNRRGPIWSSAARLRHEALNVVVVVNPDGRVGSVKGLLAPQNMNEFMLLTTALSNVKTWRDHAAMKGTEPVAYRLVVLPGSTSRFAP